LRQDSIATLSDRFKYWYYSTLGAFLIIIIGGFYANSLLIVHTHINSRHKYDVYIHYDSGTGLHSPHILLFDKAICAIFVKHIILTSFLQARVPIAEIRTQEPLGSQAHMTN
jgi:hypothetical protein